MERELITRHEANLLMVAVLLLAPLIGLGWGAAAKRVKTGLVLGLLVGIGNAVLWVVYNQITDHLGLDTVKNLLVNLGLFAAVGIIVGLAASRCDAKARKGKT